MNRFNVLIYALSLAISSMAFSSPKEAHTHDLGYDLPTDASKSDFAVKGEFGGKMYFETAVPRYILTVDGGLREDGTVPVGTALKPKNFIRFRGVNHYELTDLPKGKKSLQPRYFVDGRFVSIK